MRLFDSARRLFISQLLQLGPNAVMRLRKSDGSTVEVDLEEMSKLNPADTVEDLTEASTLTVAQSGKTLFLNSATEFATTLPAPAAGLRYRFVVKAAPSGAAYTILTNASANILIGGISELEVDTGDDGPYGSAADTITFADGVAAVGDWVSLESDGTSWYLTGQARLDGGITLTQAS
jgi:hypothetical protein